MAIYNGRILMRKGNEADFDPSKLMSGEWAVSLDAGIVRICLEAGKVIRMATYEAFEEDMKQIEAILLECQTIEEAVQRINTEINAKVDAVVEYVGQAKTYRDEAKTFRDEAEAFKNQAGEIAGIDIATTEKAGIVKPDGETLEVDTDGTMRVIGGGGVSDYTELENKPSINGTELNGDKTLNDLGIASATELEKTNTKVDTIIEKADLGIKETASGEEIHLIDSAEGKAVEFALYGKARQNTTSGKNLLENTYSTKTINGITFTVNDDGSITANGTSTGEIQETVGTIVLKSGEYKLSGCPKNATGYRLDVSYGGIIVVDTGDGGTISITEDTTVKCYIRIRTGYTLNNVVFYPMIRLASITDDTYEPYTNGASPNPQYPQPIEVSGESGSVAVKSCGKNLYNSQNVVNGAYNNNGYINVNTWRILVIRVIPNSDITLSGFDNQNGAYSVYLNSADYMDFNRHAWNTQANNGTHKIPSDVEWVGICYFSSNDGANIQIEYGAKTTYEPYRETLSTILTPNGLAGIKVSSNGNYTDQNGQQWICDEVVKYADGSGEYIQRIGSAILDGTISNYKIHNGYGVMHQSVETIMPNVKKGANRETRMMSNIRPWIKGNAWTVGSFGVENTTFWFEDTNNVLFPTVEDWINYLTETNMEILYELAEPIHTPLTAEEIAEIEKLHTFYPVTNISNDFDCGMSVTYYCDSKNYIDNKIALLTTAMVNNI